MAFNGLWRSALTWDIVPELRDPYCIAGFYGWSNAGGVSSDALEVFVRTLKPQVFARISQEPFMDFTLDRPIGRIQDGVIHELEPLETEVKCWKSPGAEHDLVLLLGKEPHMGWYAYSGIITTLMTRLSVTRLYTVGGVQDTISHYAPPVVSIVGSSPYVVGGAAKLEDGVRTGEYHGPVSIHTYLIQACADAGIEVVSLWGHVPAYLQKSPRVVAKIVTILNKATKIECPIDGLEREAIEFDRKIEEALLKDPSLKRLVASIEREAPPSRPRSPDNVIRLNDFLRRDPHDDGTQ
jgi:proteasome assembly chaperone (PAC2) family protein